MSSPFQGIDIAARALAAFQQALNVTGNNIANVNTPGYSRQTVQFNEVTPTTSFGLKILSFGNGVGIQKITRIQDAFLLARKIASQGDVGKSASLSDTLGQIETLTAEGNGTGVSDALNQLFTSFSALASNPNDQGSQTQVQLAAETLAQRVQQTYSNLESVKGQLKGDITQTFQDIDSLTTQIDQLNTQIRGKVASGEQPNDLLDQRDQAVTKLSQLVNIHTTNFSDGTVNIYADQMTLVDQSGARPFPTTYDPIASTVTDANGTYNITAGKLGGLMQGIKTINGYETTLDNFANTLRNKVNTIYAAGVNSQGQTNQLFFSGTNGASDFDLDAPLKGNAQLIATGTSGNAGDGGLALSLSQLSSDTTMFGGQSPTQFYANFVGQVGRDSAFYKSTLATQGAVDSQINNQIQSTSGVSLDEEMSNMLRFQRSYEASARALSVFDTVTQDLINMIH
jgi:flagellar hook-associated protein 1